ncbi:hypothetical protein LTR95_015929 [Oleoguttula sp. CCFEE 5521]
MPEPLSITTGVASLISVGFKTVWELTEFIGKVKDAPQEVVRTRDELAAINHGLCQLQDLLQKPKIDNAMRKSKKAIGDILESCKGTFEEVAKEAYRLDTGVWRKLGWVASQGKMQQLCMRIESNKTSLSLILEILTWKVVSRRLCGDCIAYESRYSKTDARMEKRLERNNILLGYIAKNQ